jgi:hypothetical protein
MLDVDLKWIKSLFVFIKKEIIAQAVFYQPAYQATCLNQSYLGPCNKTSITSANSAIAGSSVNESMSDRSSKLLDVRVSPNPSPTDFKIRVSSSSNEAITIRLIDNYGKVISIHNKVQKDQTITIGKSLLAGNYFAEIIQGTSRKIIKLIKQ